MPIWEHLIRNISCVFFSKKLLQYKVVSVKVPKFATKTTYIPLTMKHKWRTFLKLPNLCPPFYNRNALKCCSQWKDATPTKLMLGNISPNYFLSIHFGEKTGKTLTFNSIVYKHNAKSPADASGNANLAKGRPKADNCGAPIKSELS